METYIIKTKLLCDISDYFSHFSGKQRFALRCFVSKLEDCGCIVGNRIHELEFAQQGYYYYYYYKYLFHIMVELAFVSKRQELVALQQFGNLCRQIIMTRGYKLLVQCCVQTLDSKTSSVKRPAGIHILLITDPFIWPINSCGIKDYKGALKSVLCFLGLLFACLQSYENNLKLFT